MRKFEIVTKEEYLKNVEEMDHLEYDDLMCPVRSTKHSAGYDFRSPISFTLKSNEIIKVPTGIKASMESDEYLALLVRSSMGFKYNMRLCNQVGIVDSDYYNNPDNEGHIFIKIQNEGEKDIVINKGDRFAQGIFSKYLLVDDDSSDSERAGGFGSTGKGD